MNKEFFIVNDNINKLYRASAEAKNLLNESKRKIKSESTTWYTRNAKSLIDIALQVIANHFTAFYRYFNSDVLSEKNKNQLLCILPTNLPLELTSKILPDGIFWKRAYHDMWQYDYVSVERIKSWKNAYMQKYLQNYVEGLYPNDVNYDEIEELIKMVRCDVFSLNIEQLLTFDFYEHGDAEVKHVDLRLILPFLSNLENLSIKSGMRSTGLRFSENLFELTTADCINIAESLRSLRNLKKIKITCCNLNRHKMQPILLSLVSLSFLQSVDFSSNDISDDCFGEIVEMLSEIPVLKKIVAVNNKIGPQGAQRFATVLHKYESLEYFDLRLNFVLDSGATELFKAAESHLFLRTLILCSNKISSLSGPSLCNLISTNKCIQEIDLSCNTLGGGHMSVSLHIGRRKQRYANEKEKQKKTKKLSQQILLEKGTGIALVEALQKNEILQRLDLKMNHIGAEQDEKISQKLMVNRKIQRKKLKLNKKV